MKHWIIEKLEVYGETSAIAFSNQIYSYKDLVAEINIAKKYLKDHSVFNGNVVAITSDYSFKAIAIFFALIENENIIVPITSTVKQEINERLIEGYCDKQITINNEYHLENLPNDKSHVFIESLQKDKKPGLILFSSGSTGKPKAMVLDLDKVIKSYENGHGNSYVTLIFLMFDHIGGVNTLFHILSSGGFAVFTENRDPDQVSKLIAKYKVELLPSSPTFLNLILISESHKKYNLNSLKLITYGTEAMPESLLNRVKEAFPNAKLKQTFGTSETGIFSTKSKSNESLFMKLGGKGFEYKITNDELFVKSDLSMLGYLNAENPFTEDGWFPTGDLVEVDKEGFVKIIGRTKEVINVGGEKVLPAEIESVLLEMKELDDVMAYAEKNSITGQNVAVEVVIKDGVDPKTIKKMIRIFCRGKLDNYKIPTSVTIVEKVSYGDRFKKIRRK